MWSAKAAGMAVGFGLGWAYLEFGFLATVFLAVCTAAGWFVGRVLEGEVSLVDLLQRYSGRERV